MKTYKTADLAKEWGTSPEAVRRYVREIKNDPELMKAGLIEITKGGVLITEEGYLWINERRSRWTDFQANEATPEDREAQNNELERLRMKLEYLEKENTFMRDRINFLESHSEALLSTIQAQQVLTLSHTSRTEESPQNNPTASKNTEEKENAETITKEKQDSNNTRATEGFKKRFRRFFGIDE